MTEPSTTTDLWRADAERQPRAYSWAPFDAGNDAAVRHGAHSERRLAPIVDELLEGLAAAAPWTSAPVFAPTRQAWAHAEAQAVTYRRHFDDNPMLTADGDAAGLGQWHRAEQRASTLRTELGLSPASLSRLLSSLSTIDGPAAKSGLEALRAAGAALRAGVERPGLLQSVDGGSDDPGDVGELGHGGTV